MPAYEPGGREFASSPALTGDKRRMFTNVQTTQSVRLLVMANIDN